MYRYLPSGRRQLRQFQLVADFINQFALEKIKEVKENIKGNEKASNFISAYLREIEKSDGKLEDRSTFLLHTKISTVYLFMTQFLANVSIVDRNSFYT